MTDCPDSVLSVLLVLSWPPLPIFPILPLGALESSEKGWLVQDSGDERRITLAFRWNTVPTEAKAAGDGSRDPYAHG